MRDYLDEYIVATRLIQRPAGATVGELAEALEKTERAVYNIINQLNAIYFPIYTEADPENQRKMRYHADKGFAEYLPDLKITDQDKVVFNYLVDNSANTPSMDIAARHLFTKIKLMVAERGSLIENGINKPLLLVSSKNVVKDIDNKAIQVISDILLSAIEKKQWVTLYYKKLFSDNAYSKNVFPVVMFVSKGDYYVYVLNEKEELRMLAVERISEIVKSEKKAAPKKKVDINALLNDPFGAFIDHEPFTIRLFVDDTQDIFEKTRRWPDSVSFEDVEDGSIMTVTTGCHFDAKRWILKRTPTVKVLEPQWLVDEIIEALKAGLDLYGMS